MDPRLRAVFTIALIFFSLPTLVLTLISNYFFGLTFTQFIWISFNLAVTSYFFWIVNQSFLKNEDIIKKKRKPKKEDNTHQLEKDVQKMRKLEKELDQLVKPIKLKKHDTTISKNLQLELEDLSQQLKKLNKMN